MDGFSTYATLRNLLMQTENIIFLLGILIFLSRIIPRVRKRKFVSRATTVTIGLALGFVFAVSVLPLTSVVRYLSGPESRLLDDTNPCECIVVLGGGLLDKNTLSKSSYVRTVCGVRAFKKYSTGYMVVTGGDPMNLGKTEGAVMAELATSLGVPADQILIEGNSLNTWLNAVYTSQILKEKGIQTAAIVTSSVHCRRSYLVFEHAGVETFVIPCGELESAAGPAMPVNLSKIRLINGIMYEFIGMAYYKLRGWI